jgi:hypothetical protein
MSTDDRSSKLTKGRLSIDKIDAAPPAAEARDRWSNVVGTFTPLGPIAEAYAKTLAYRLESKRLKLELARVQEQAKVIHNVIDKTYQLKMEELEHRRVALERAFDTAQEQLKNLHVERMTVLQMAQEATRKTLESGLSLDERRMYQEMAMNLVATLPQFGDRANQSLQVLIQALPPVQTPRGLLDSGE